MIKKNSLIAAILLATLTTTGCTMQKNSVQDSIPFPAFAYEGHRGARGLYPENSIGAMKVAIDLPKVTTLEMDCHITKDKQVVVYHDHYLNPKFVLDPNGKELEGKQGPLIYDLTYKELAAYDIGTKPYADFPEQQKTETHIALLRDLIKESEAYAKQKRQAPMFYNIETKSKEGKDGEYHPAPNEFSDLLVAEIIKAGIAPRTVIQSFDKRTIQYINEKYPAIKTSYLIDAKNKQSIQEIISELGFKPYILSPNYNIVTQDLLNQAKQQGIKVIPWTVNTAQEIESLKKLGVDGIISDYPNLF